MSVLRGFVAGYMAKHQGKGVLVYSGVESVYRNRAQLFYHAILEGGEWVFRTCDDVTLRRAHIDTDRHK